MAEVVVGPVYRDRGIGTTLVAAALSAGGDGARVWAHGDLPAAKAVASKLDLKPARELLQMRRPLDTEIPELVVPEGITLRTYAGSADDREILRVNSAAFSWHPEQGGWTEHDVEVRRESDWFDPAGLFLATDPDGTLLGFHWTKVHTGTDGTDEPADRRGVRRRNRPGCAGPRPRPPAHPRRSAPPTPARTRRGVALHRGRQHRRGTHLRTTRFHPLSRGCGLHRTLSRRACELRRNRTCGAAVFISRSPSRGHSSTDGTYVSAVGDVASPRRRPCLPPEPWLGAMSAARER